MHFYEYTMCSYSACDITNTPTFYPGLISLQNMSESKLPINTVLKLNSVYHEIHDLLENTQFVGYISYKKAWEILDILHIGLHSYT